MKKKIIVQGVFVADLAFWTEALPRKGETFIGKKFHVNPGGKGSNQAVAAQRAGGDVCFLTKLGQDEFGKLARDFYQAEGMSQELVFTSKETGTGAAAISILEGTGENSIIVVPGAGAELRKEEIDQARSLMTESGIFLTQFETPLEQSFYGLKMAKKAGWKTILNPAPAAQFEESQYEWVDMVTPNEVEAEQLTGIPVRNLEDASRAADFFLDRGVKDAVITLGENGAFIKNREVSEHIPAMKLGKVVDTTGAGDAFSGGLCAALSEGKSLVDAVRFGNVTAGISVTRVGTAKSTPYRREIDQNL